MAGAAANLDTLAAPGNVVEHGQIRVQGVAALVEIGHLLFGTQANLASLGFQLPQQQFDQGTFTRAIGADETDLVTTHQGEIQVSDQRCLARITKSDASEFSHQFAGALAGIQRDACDALLLTAGLAFPPQPFQSPHAAFIAGPSGLDALADPGFFLGELFVEQRVVAGFLFELLFLFLLITVKRAAEYPQDAAIQVPYGGCQPLRQGTVVTYEQQCAAIGGEKTLKPFHRGNIQMVGRFVQNQQVRFAHQGPGQCRAPLPAARERGDGNFRIQIEAIQHAVDTRHQFPPMGVVNLALQVRVLGFAVFAQPNTNIAEPGGHVAVHGVGAVFRQRLLQGSEHRSTLADYLTGIRIPATTDQTQQARLPFAIAAYQADPITALDFGANLIGQHLYAIAQTHAIQLKQHK